uniref:prosaposin-like n=1 Tax=Myxine glutinosa TaxID=7769 RepID=UPI00358E0EE8
MVTVYPVFLLLCTLGLSSGLPSSRVLGTEACTHGPSYWCKNLATAVECDAVKHCKQTVWNNSVASDGVCDLCQEVFKVVQDFVTNNDTEKIVRQYLFQMCQMLPGKDISAQCEDLVKTYLPLIMDMLKEQLKPGTICRSLGLCMSLQESLAPSNVPKSSPLLTNIIPILIRGAPVQVPSSVCQDCDKFLTDLQKEIKENGSFIEALKNSILKNCDFFPPGISEQCKAYINKFTPEALKFILSMPPSHLCQMGGFCSGVSGAVPMMSLTAAKPVGIPLVPLVKQAPHSDVTVKGLPSCAICTFVVKKLESILENNATEAEIKEALLKVCGYLPEAYMQECDALVDEYEDMLVQLLMQSLDPDYVCSVLGLCQSAKKHSLVGEVQCTWGPGFWCLSHENAKQCDAEDFCKRHKWV